MDSTPENEDFQGLFEEPKDFFTKEKENTFENYSLQSGQELRLRLVGHNPLWGHMLWNAGRTIADYLEKEASLFQGKYVLEFGAAAALPSLVCALKGAAKVVATDYPDTVLIENITYNIQNSTPNLDASKIVAEGFLWGSSTDHLTAHLPGGDQSGFHVLILADVVFNHSEHAKLVQSIRDTLRPGGVALVWFTPYRPWLIEKDLDFFRVADEGGLAVEKMFEKLLDKPLFKNDPGDENLRKTVYAYRITWKGASP